MKKVRIGVLFGILLSGIFVTWYGGEIPYRLFYFFLSIPVVCFVYTLYVYLRFKIYQSVEHKTLVKEERATYHIHVGNEDIITYENIKLLFFDDFSLIEGSNSIKEYCLLPGQKKEYKTAVLCKYRGSYSIGVKAVQITDFLHLFQITYPIRETCKVLVLPKIVELEQCFFLKENPDEKCVSTLFSMERPKRDIETRLYQSGDDVRMIHWKASAKCNQLLTRKWIGVTKPEVVIAMEMLPSPEEESIIYEDKLLESVLAITFFCLRQNTLCQIVYEQEEIRQQDIYDYSSFNAFYHATAQLYFRGKLGMEQILASYVARENQILVLFVSNVTETFRRKVSTLVSENRRVVVFIIGDKDEKVKIKEPMFFYVSYGAEVKRALEQGELV